MNLKSSKKIASNTYKLEIKISPEDFAKALDRAFKRDSRKISLPGFRKGKAPKAFIEKYYGETIFFDTAVNMLYPQAISAGFEEFGQKVVGSENSEVTEIGKDTGVTISITVFTYPEVEIKDYKDIEVEDRDTNVTEDDINKEIETRISRNARLVSLEDAAAQEKDTVIMDFEGSIDGKVFDGGTGKDFTVNIGQGRMIPGFEEQICGHKINEEFEIKVTFPENYSAKELAAKKATFKCVLHVIKRPELPEFNEEFVQDTSEFDNIKDYKDDIKTTLEKKKLSEKSNFISNTVSEKLKDLVQVEVPSVMVSNMEEQQKNNLVNSLSSMGINSIEQYSKLTNIPMEELNSKCREIAEAQVKINLALDKIAELENIEVTDEDIKDFAKKHFDKESKIEDIDKFIKDIHDKEWLNSEIKRQKAMELVKSSVKLVKAKKKTQPKPKKEENLK